MNIIQIINKFSTQESCIEYLEKKRWNNEPHCPYCGSTNTNHLKKQLRHHCNGCRKSFSVTVGTIFHDTRLPLQKWFLAIALILNARKGISSLQLSRDLELPYKTAWSMTHRIRKAMKSDNGLLSGIVEMDETYIGGKPRKENKKNKDDDDKGSPRGRATKKECVVGMIERGGKVKAGKVSKNELKAKDLQEMVRQNLDVQNSVLMTDEYKGYLGMNKVVKHFKINHSKEYARGQIHTNSIESFWAIVKRGMFGQFHWVSKKYLSRYMDEFCWRFNNRDSESNFDDLVGNMLFAK
jgi:transposase-like protein